MTVTRGMLDEPARGGGVLAGLGLAGSLPFSPVSLGRNRVKERQPDGMIRRRRLGLTALSSPARVGFYSEVGIPLPTPSSSPARARSRRGLPAARREVRGGPGRRCRPSWRPAR